MTSSSSASFPLQEICTRAIDDPSSITPAERNLIQARPDPETENSLYLAKTSLPLSGLIAKALADPPTLSTEEAHVLVHGPEDRTSAEKAARTEKYHALTLEQRQLVDRASNAVTDPDEKKAKNIAWKLLPAGKAVEAARQRIAAGSTPQPSSHGHGSPQQSSSSNPPRRKPIVLPWERADWVTLIREKNYSSWGLPVLRTAYNDPAAWLTFKTRLSTLASRELAQCGGPTISETFEIEYIEDEEHLANAEQAGLLGYYARLSKEGRLKAGFSWGVFMTADDNVLDIFRDGNRELVVPVWEAGWKAGEVSNHGWRGALAFRAEMVFRVLLEKLVRGDPKPLEGLNMMAQDR